MGRGNLSLSPLATRRARGERPEVPVSGSAKPPAIPRWCDSWNVSIRFAQCVALCGLRSTACQAPRGALSETSAIMATPSSGNSRGHPASLTLADVWANLLVRVLPLRQVHTLCAFVAAAAGCVVAHTAVCTARAALALRQHRGTYCAGPLPYPSPSTRVSVCLVHGNHRLQRARRQLLHWRTRCS